MDNNYQKYYTDGVSKYCYKKFVFEFKNCCTDESYIDQIGAVPYSTLHRWIIRANLPDNVEEENRAEEHGIPEFMMDIEVNYLNDYL